MLGLFFSKNEPSEQISYVVQYYIIQKDFQIVLNVFSSLCLLLRGMFHACFNNPRLILTPAFYLLQAFLLLYDVDVVELNDSM